MNPQQANFVAAYVAGSGNATRAAITAGYSPDAARQTASRLLSLPHVQEAIRREHNRLLRGPLASKALGVLERIMDDESAPYGARVDAAKTVLDRAGLIAPRVVEADAGDKPLNEMSLEELDAFIDQGLRELLAVKTSRRESLPAKAC